MQLFGDAEVVFASHHWPVWGRERVVDYLKQQRDIYRYIHDQTLRLANAGPHAAGDRRAARAARVAARRRSPTAATTAPCATTRRRSTRPTSAGTTATPANLDPLPPVEAGARYVEAMGGAAEVRAQGAGGVRARRLSLGRDAAEPPRLRRARTNAEARELLAPRLRPARLPGRVGPWRDVYLTGASSCATACSGAALDLARRAGPAAPPAARALLRRRWPRASNGPRGRRQGADDQLRLHRPRRDATCSSSRTPSCTTAARDPDPDAAATVRLTRDFLLRLVTRPGRPARDALLRRARGRRQPPRAAVLLLAARPPRRPFPIVTP